MNKLKEIGFVYENSTDYLIEQQRVICNGFEDRVNKMLTNNSLFISITNLKSYKGIPSLNDK